MSIQNTKPQIHNLKAINGLYHFSLLAAGKAYHFSLFPTCSKQDFSLTSAPSFPASYLHPAPFHKPKSLPPNLEFDIACTGQR